MNRQSFSNVATSRGALVSLVLLLGCTPTAVPPAEDSNPDVTATVTTSDAPSDQTNSPAQPDRKPSDESSQQPAVSARPLAERSAGGETMFTLLDAESTGVDFFSPLDTDHPLKRLYNSGFATGGICIGDVNGDERPDLFFCSGPTSNRLYIQTGPLEFEDVTEQAGLSSGDDWSGGAAMNDIDGDGDLDLFVCNYQIPCKLYLNDGNGKFSTSAAPWLKRLADACMMPSFCDYDLDGDLDLFVLTNRYYRRGGRPRNPPVTKIGGVPVVIESYQKYYGLTRRANGGYDIDTVGRPNYLMRNNGDGTFSDVSKAAGLWGYGHGLSATWWDYNGDRLPDVYVANDYNDADRLYQNNGDGTFTDVLVEAVPHTSWFSMGADSADLDGDGRFDLLVADMSARTHYDQKTTMGAMNAEKLKKVSGPPPQIMKNALLLGSGTARLFEAAELAGLADTDWTWSIKLADFDNDALADVAITNGMVRNFNNSDIPLSNEDLIGRTVWSYYEDTPPRPEQNLIKKNLGNLQFRDTSDAWGFNHVGMSYGCAYGDLDRDGDLDMVVVNLDEQAHVYRNDSASGNRLLVSLKGSDSNRYGIGARLTLTTPDARPQIRMLLPSSGFLSSNDPVVHFGLGDATTIESLVIDWPSGARQELRDVEANQWLTVVESAGQSAPQPEPDAKRMPLFAAIDQMPAVRHRELPYDDFARQPLLPNKLSQLGPGVAVADINGDGEDDVYLGGASGQAGTLLVANGHGGFRRLRSPAFNEDDAAEDMGAVWIDVEGDGDHDLYVVSGGVECEPDDPVLQDRLYLNDGQGAFTKAPEGTLPELHDSGSSVCAADFDRDGDLDLFVGSRVIPGAYPASPKSRLLRNDGGKFTDVTEEIAPSLLEAGLVTGGVWSDANGDGWVDLLLATEWGPIKLLVNRDGKLDDATAEAGLAERLGWYNGIAAGDWDSDGDTDYAVTNFGLNTKYHASVSKPALLYYGDFEGEGKKRLVEAEFESDTLFPIRGKSCSTNAMPMLGDKFSSYREFASATLQDIYTPTCLDDADRFECNSLETGILWNDGSGRFEFTPLPWLAQISPAFSIVATEVDGDGHPDIYLTQNFFTAQPETGRMDGGMGLLLRGTGDRQFEPILPGESGLSVPGDAKSAVVAHTAGSANVALLVGINDEAPQAFRRIDQPTPETETPAAGKHIVVKLKGPSGNPTAYGARIELTTSDGFTQTAEVSAGQGYLSQTSAATMFAVRPGSTPQAIRVRWPDGSETTTAATTEVVQTVTYPLQ